MLRHTMVVLATSLFIGGCSSNATAPGETLATVGSQRITTGDLALMTKFGTPEFRARLSAPGGKKQVVEQLVDRELLYQRGMDLGLAADPDVARQLEWTRRATIAEAVVRTALDDAAKTYYNAHPEEFAVVELQHLLIRFGGTQAEQPPKPPRLKNPALAVEAPRVERDEAAAIALANQLKSRIQAGEDFAKVAQEVSEDANTKRAGGRIGPVWRQEPRLMRRGWEPVLETAFQLKPDEVGGPIKTKDGYHLLLVRGPAQQRSFEEAREVLRFRIQSDTRRKLIQELKGKTKTTLSLPEADKAPAGQPQMSMPPHMQGAGPHDAAHATPAASPAHGTPPLDQPASAPPPSPHP
ncbi:MAG: peptidylprolyl isomerase [Deltaproteobacteria bacterium]|nr:peptidylprolyl isomerase [Deltaproteobacteria bacterium]